MRTSVLIGCLIVFASVTASAQDPDEDLFPVPVGLEPDVNFWLSVFTDYSTREGVLHDNRFLGVVYERVPLPENVNRRERQRIANRRRDYYKGILQALAGGNRDNLNAEQKRVLDLWPADVSDAELGRAAGRIRLQLGLSDRFKEGLQRAGRWRYHVEAELTRLGVPIELAALPHVESSYNPEARSHVGASGVWQFTRGTGRRFMQVDHVLDERNDPFLATTAAGKLLAYNYSIAGNWPMAITAYNHGLAGARRAMRQFGDNAYAEILRKYNGRTFGFASRNFYVAFLAAKEVDLNQQKYFPGLVPDDPVDYTTHRLTGYVPADKLLEVLQVRERDIARHNMSIQATVWQGSKHLPRDLEIRMPTSMVDGELSELIAKLSADDVFDEQLPDLFHAVARGDTLSEIADTYSTRVSTLVALNSLSSGNRIRIGQQIRLPAAGPAPAEPVPTVVAAAPPPPVVVADNRRLTPEETVIANAPAQVPAVVEASDNEGERPSALTDQLSDLIGTLQSSLLSDPSDYTVDAENTIEIHPLETLGHYADWLGIKTQRVRDINGLAFRTQVEVGQRIKLDFGTVDAGVFESSRTQYHRQLQDTFFRNNTITGVQEHVVRNGESVWILALRQYDVPVWLFRQYNPELDLHNVRVGTRLNFPILVKNEQR
ncbi:MAG: LysM peptidoglycan-binding domain-containing protein [Woeseiaceae bacterium]|nr:LysM peptidoglycan-binding domain-containing protein [Woeseiaceae bacterium]